MEQVKMDQFYMLDGITGDIVPEDMAKIIRSFLATENIYTSAIREVETKLNNLNDDFKYSKDRNPIHQIKTRVKTPKSIIEKLIRKGFDLTVESARANLDDIAGVRIICSYIDDIYLMSDLLSKQNDIEVIRTTDYIKNPKPNGYRSLHIIITVPVFLSARIERVKVEVQIRTIAMDFWASLEHELAYKLDKGKTEDVIKELKGCADVIAETDKRMQKLYNIVDKNNGKNNGYNIDNEIKDIKLRKYLGDSIHLSVVPTDNNGESNEDIESKAK